MDFERVLEKHNFMVTWPRTLQEYMNFNSLTFVWEIFYSSVKKNRLEEQHFFRGLLEKHKLYQTLYTYTSQCYKQPLNFKIWVVAYFFKFFKLLKKKEKKNYKSHLMQLFNADAKICWKF